MTGKTQEEIIALITEAGEQAVQDDLEYYTAADVYKPDDVDKEALYEQLNAGLIQTEGAFKNLTRTTANTATQQFETALDRAWLQISTGAFAYNTAMRNAIIDLSSNGLGAVKYPSGRVDSIEVAVRRAVVTGANQTASKVQEKLADQLDVELVEVTAHGGARPEHAKWQGKVYSRRGRVEIDGVVYEDLAKATGYGSGAGLCGWNCRHNFHPYIHGTARTWNDKQLERLEEKNIEYNGVLMTEYEASQAQRGIERDIRKLKRTVAALEAVGEDASEYRASLRKAQKTYTDFTNQTGIKKQPARTQIATGTGTATPTEKYNGNITNTIVNSANSDTITAGGVTDSFDRKARASNVEEDLAAVNPNYSTKEYKWINNCQRCAPTFEMRRRGFKVTAKPIPTKLENDYLALDYAAAWERKDVVWCMRGNGLEQIREKMATWGNGARATVRVVFNTGTNGGKGHVFIAEQRDGVTVFLDPQTGDTDCSRYFDKAIKGKTNILRIDNNKPSAAILDCCENGGG